MPKAVPQRSTQHIFDELRLFIINSNQVGAFTAKKFEKEIGKIPDQRERELLHAYLLLAENKFSEVKVAIDSFQRRLQIVESHEFISFSLMLRSAGFSSESFALLAKGVEVAASPRLLEEYMSHSIVHLRLNDFDNGLSKLKKLKAEDQINPEEYEICLTESRLIRQWIDSRRIADDVISIISKIIISIADSNGLNLPANRITENEHDEWLSINYILIAESTNQEQLFDLNDQLFDLLLENDLLDIPVVVQFIRVGVGHLNKMREKSINVC